MAGGDNFVPVWRVALFRCCPRCGQGALYASYLKLAPGCAVCGLDYAAADSGDGPAVFVIFIVGALAAAIGFWFQAVVQPPLWLFMMVLTALILGLSLALLPVFKAALVSLQFRNRAGEGREED